MRFDSFETEECCDFVEVYDGTSATGTLKGQFSGSAPPPIQTATSGSMFIRFTSDDSFAKDGVSMTWLDAMPDTLAPTKMDGIHATAAVVAAPTSGHIVAYKWAYMHACGPHRIVQGCRYEFMSIPP